ncbi:MAG: DnaJ domain-containing protein [Acaryochloridaceae cyanobacterium SU_2_1]|nr:DnaJ domain-containing protein [Acaryochloridaceae cyanobacterium SU_2_1]NJM95095.1 DnaJ domain-containing protein [Acaryochloridaceae cyanobacterium CSU_5_19]
MPNLNDCYRTLELKSSASLEEVNQAYKDLVFIWHPDRIPKDRDRLQQKAIAKLQALNQAREYLQAYLQRRAKLYNGRAVPPAAPRSAGFQASQQQSTSVAAPSSSYAPSVSTRVAEARAPQKETSSPQASASKRAAQRWQTQPTAAAPRPAPASKKSHLPDHSGVDWQGADLQERDLSGRNLSQANLAQANLKDAFLHKINLSGANLSGANLMRANLLQANLSQANLQGANLACADLSGADLSGANFTGATLGQGSRAMVKLTGANLSGAIMPDGTIHA